MDKDKKNNSTAIDHLIQEITLMADRISIAEKERDDYKKYLEDFRSQLIDGNTDGRYDVFIRSINENLNDKK